MIVEKDFLDDKYSHGLAELRTSLHDSEAERDDFGRQEEVDHVGRVVLDKSTNDSERGQP